MQGRDLAHLTKYDTLVQAQLFRTEEQGHTICLGKRACEAKSSKPLFQRHWFPYGRHTSEAASMHNKDAQDHPYGICEIWHYILSIVVV